MEQQFLLFCPGSHSHSSYMGKVFSSNTHVISWQTHSHTHNYIQPLWQCFHQHLHTICFIALTCIGVWLCDCVCVCVFLWAKSEQHCQGLLVFSFFVRFSFIVSTSLSWIVVRQSFFLPFIHAKHINALLKLLVTINCYAGKAFGLKSFGVCWQIFEFIQVHICGIGRREWNWKPV